MLDEHVRYLCDSERLNCYRSALSKTIGSGDRVVDLGCGTGILGLLCLEAGAEHVTFIDERPILEVARRTLQSAGFAGRCTFISGNSHRVDLTRDADLVVCDHVGFFGFDYGIVHTLRDARLRFLNAKGRVMPSRLRPVVAAVSSVGCRELMSRWDGVGSPDVYRWLRQIDVNTKHPVKLQPADILSEPAVLAELDLGDEEGAFYSWKAELAVTHAGRVDGIAGWFEAELADGVWLTNSPLSSESIDRNQACLPLADAVEVQAGEVIAATLVVRPADHQLAWTVTFPRSGRTFRQSTWRGSLLSADQIRRSDPDRVPILNAQGRARALILSYCDGKRSAREITEVVLRNHAALFPSRGETERFVAAVLGRDCSP